MQNIVSLQDKTIIVTGAAQGIGQAVATLALELGANVVVVDLNGEAIDAFAARHGGRVAAFTGNVADPEFAARSVEAAIALRESDAERYERAFAEALHWKN